MLPALEALERGGTLAIAGIHLTDIPTLDYQRHLFEERSLCSVTANTRQDGVEFLEAAAGIPIQVSAVRLPDRPGRPGPHRPGPRPGQRRGGLVRPPLVGVSGAPLTPA